MSSASCSGDWEWSTLMREVSFLKKGLEEFHGDSSQPLTVCQEVHITLVMSFSMWSELLVLFLGAESGRAGWRNLGAHLKMQTNHWKKIAHQIAYIWNTYLFIYLFFWHKKIRCCLRCNLDTSVSRGTRREFEFTHRCLRLKMYVPLWILLWQLTFKNWFHCLWKYINFLLPWLQLPLKYALFILVLFKIFTNIFVWLMKPYEGETENVWNDIKVSATERF